MNKIEQSEDILESVSNLKYTHMYITLYNNEEEVYKFIIKEEKKGIIRSIKKVLSKRIKKLFKDA